MSLPRPWMLVCGSCLSLLSIILGAFAAHGLKSSLTPYSIAIFQTGVEYQMYHGIAIFLVGILSGFGKFSYTWLKAATISFLVGCLFFSGSLFLLALTGIKWLGAITPIGGVAFIVGWTLLIYAAVKTPAIE